MSIAGSLWEQYAGLVCDLDGVVYRGSSAVPHAVSTLDAVGRQRPVLYATNNASRSPGAVVDHLRSLGVEVVPEHVVTSAQAIARVAAAALPRRARVLVVGADALAEAFAAEGLVPVRPSDRSGQVEAVVQGYGPGVTAADLAEAAYALQGGARWFASNRDLTLPTDRGIAPGGGALVAAVAQAVDPGLAPTVAGKPEPPLYRLAAERAGVDVRECLAVGDRLDTDILGANRAGCDSLWVLTGVDGLESLVSAPEASRATPTYAATDLRALGSPVRTASSHDGGWSCGGWWVRLAGNHAGRVEFERLSDDRPDGRPRGGTDRPDPDALLQAAMQALCERRDDGSAAWTPTQLQDAARRLGDAVATELAAARSLTAL